MPPVYECPRCNRAYTPEEAAENGRFCECGTRLRRVRRSGKAERGWRRLFPYEPYPQQVGFIEDVESVVGGGGVLIAEACTGFGKTVSSLSCLLEMGRSMVYATRTHEQVRQVLHEIEAINRKSGASFTAVNLASRGHLCINPECRELPRREAQELCRALRADEECPYESEIPEPPRGLPPVMSREALLRSGRRRRLCPYYLARRLSRRVRVTVAPYPYVFDPQIRLSIGLDLEGKALILDEGHNIDKVGQDIFSDTLGERGLSAAAEEMRLLGKPQRHIRRLEEHLQRECSDEPKVKSAESLRRDLELALGMELGAFMDQYAPLVESIRALKLEAGNPPVSYLSGVLDFIELLQTSRKEKYTAVYTRNYYGANVIEYRCLDPSLAVRPLVEEASGVLIMSGTLSPLDLFAEIIGLPDAEKRTYPSIQDPDNVRMVIETGVTTAYRERTQEMILSIGRAVAEHLERVPQGALIFFTQRGFMSHCLDVWGAEGVIKARGGRLYLGEKQLFREGRDARRNREVVERYKRMAVSVGGAVLCCVFRGRNSEGSNFPDDQARGIFLVGVPYASYGDPLVRAQISYFDRQRRGLGRRWYTMDAFRAANQSLGRGMRGRDDWCHYWLLDRRYAENLGLISRWAQGRGAEIVSSGRPVQRTL